MRGDAYVTEVLNRCDSLRRAGLWPSEQILRPREWLSNFEEADKPVAAALLERFDFYNSRLCDLLFVAAYNGLGDALEKGPRAPATKAIINSLQDAVFAPIQGEEPRPTDSGHLLCRRARQLLSVPDERIVNPELALNYAIGGKAVVFVDDFVGSGDQFLCTWTRRYRQTGPHSFKEAAHAGLGPMMYVALVATAYGLSRIATHAPTVAVSAAHVLGADSTLYGIKANAADPLPNLPAAVLTLLSKYSNRLTPAEAHMQQDLFTVFGYKRRALLLGFEHSIPDATLPIFWARGINGWCPLIERK